MIHILIWEQKENLQSSLQRRETYDSPRINLLPPLCLMQPCPVYIYFYLNMQYPHTWYLLRNDYSFAKNNIPFHWKFTGHYCL